MKSPVKKELLDNALAYDSDDGDSARFGYLGKKEDRLSSDSDLNV